MSVNSVALLKGMTPGGLQCLCSEAASSCRQIWLLFGGVVSGKTDFYMAMYGCYVP